MDCSGGAAGGVARETGARGIGLEAYGTADGVANGAGNGGCGFRSKDGRLRDLLKTLRTATPGSLAVDPALVTRLFDQPPALARAALARPLSKRELSVLVGMADGNHVTGIAHELRISSHTCRGHVKSLLSKLGAHSQLEAVIIAVRIGLVQISDDPEKAVCF